MEQLLFLYFTQVTEFRKPSLGLNFAISIRMRHQQEDAVNSHGLTDLPVFPATCAFAA